MMNNNYYGKSTKMRAGYLTIQDVRKKCNLKNGEPLYIESGMDFNSNPAKAEFAGDYPNFVRIKFYFKNGLSGGFNSYHRCFLKKDIVTGAVRIKLMDGTSLNNYMVE